MTRVLVTGGTGFIGRALVPALLDAGHDVIVASRSANPSGFPDKTEFAHLPDLSPDTDWHDALADVDAIVHLAARVHVMSETEADPLDAFRRANVLVTQRLAEQAAAAGVLRFVYLSSIKVNGENTAPGDSFSETLAAAPQDPYAVSKLEAEQVLLGMARRTTLQPVILRPPLVYGPGVKGNFLTLLSAAAKGLPLPIGCATNIRSLIYVGNLVDAIVLSVRDGDAPGHVFLIRDAEDASVRQMYRALGTALGKTIRVVPIPRGILRLVGWLTGKSAQISRLLDSLRIDDRHIRQTLAWRPPYSMTEGLKATADWYKKRDR